MSEWKVKSGSKAVLETPVYDRDGNLVTNLSASNIEITFQVKKTEKGAAVIEKKKSVPGEIEADVPNVGYIQITLLPADTASQEIRLYKMGLKVGDYHCRIYMDDIETEDFRLEQSIVS